MREITSQIDVLNEDGTVKLPGYSFKYFYNYNRDKIHTRETRIKEWEFYQFIEDDWVIQLTIGHATLFDNFSFNFFNIITGKKYEFGKLILHKKKRIIYPNPEASHHIEYKSKNYSISFDNNNGNRSLNFSCSNKKYKKVTLNIEIENNLDNDKMVILTPFENKYQFYLNYKENYYKCKGKVVIEDKEYIFNNLKGLVDSGRGYWPFRQDWIWSSLTSEVDGIDFGWNLGYGFGDLSNATENMIFYNHKGVQLGELEVQIDLENQSSKNALIRDKNGIFEATLKPIFDNYTHTDFLYVHNKCHQVFYEASGKFKFDGKEHSFSNIRCFLEHAKNQW